MEKVTFDDLKKLYLPPKGSHKGENGKLTIIGGSHLFHGASLWALKVASRICDMVFYASVPENNELTKKLSSELYDFIAVPRSEIENYIDESDAILIGPGLTREQETRAITKQLLQKFPKKKWVIDAGSLQMMEPSWLNKNCLITPHRGEFEKLFGNELDSRFRGNDNEMVQKMAKKYGCTILLKGETDIICSPTECRVVYGGNSGMTKGGTGDVLAGLVAALACKNDLFLAACAGSFINKKAGEELFKKVGYYFNASDLCDEIPHCLFAGIV